jgi:hypothetical protein
MTPLRFATAIAAGALFSCAAFAMQDAAPSPRIVDRIDEGRLVALTGNTIPMARAQYDRGPVSPDLEMGDLVLVLQRSPELQAAFDKFIASQSEPGSPNYRHWLEPQEVGERFGTAESDIDVIEGWLRGHGFTVDRVSSDRMAIHFSGSAAQVESAFHTQIHNLDVRGHKHIANMSDPQIPAALAAVVSGIKALHDFHPHPLHRLGGQVVFDKKLSRWRRVETETDAGGKPGARTARPLFGINDPNAGLLEDVTPYDFATIYNVLPAWNEGIDGAGQTIAIAGTSEIDSDDLTTFRSAFGLPAVPSFQQIVANDINPGECAAAPNDYCGVDDQIENSLDAEWSGAIAKGAKLVLVVSGENSAGTIDTIYTSADYVIEHKTANILNVSYGLCELFEGTAGSRSYNALWETAQSEGIAVFVAAGDSGSASCDEGGDDGGEDVPYVAEYGLSVSAIASTPYNVAVGGTDFNWCDPITTSNCTGAPYWNSSNNPTTKANAARYIPEVPWNATCISTVGIQYMQYWASQLYDIGYGNFPINDAEQSCNFAASPDVDEVVGENADVNLAAFVDTVGGGGGESNCVINSTTSTTEEPTPLSCKGGWGRPAWQNGFTSAGRTIPDVSFFASSGFLGSAYLICESPGNAACSYSDTSEPTAQEVGGTSVASPTMAGVMALINQKIGGPWGGSVNVNTELYGLAARQDYAACSAESVSTSSGCYFNDIDTQSIIQPCNAGLLNSPFGANSPSCQVIHSGDNVGTLEGYSASRGYDAASGLGSLNVYNVVHAWPAGDFPEVDLSASTLTFAAAAVGTAGTAQTITLKNAGHGALTLNATGEGVTIGGTDASSFSETNTCGVSVAAGASCAIKVTFKPAAAGALTATLTLGDNATGSPQIVALTGTGEAPALKVSAASVTFASTKIGTESHSVSIKLEDTGNETLKFTGIGITGTGKSAFSETNTCGAGVAAGRSCVVSVTFKPTGPGTATADLVFTDNAGRSPQILPLSGVGSGALVSLSTAHVTFAATDVGKASAEQTVTLTNKGNQSLGKPGGGVFIGMTGKDVADFRQTNTCGSSLRAGAKCTISITFAPRTTGALSAALTFTDNAAPSPQIVTLAGTGN